MTPELGGDGWGLSTPHRWAKGRCGVPRSPVSCRCRPIRRWVHSRRRVLRPLWLPGHDPDPRDHRAVQPHGLLLPADASALARCARQSDGDRCRLLGDCSSAERVDAAVPVLPPRYMYRTGSIQRGVGRHFAAESPRARYCSTGPCTRMNSSTSCGPWRSSASMRSRRSTVVKLRRSASPSRDRSGIGDRSSVEGPDRPARVPRLGDAATGSSRAALAMSPSMIPSLRRRPGVTRALRAVGALLGWLVEHDVGDRRGTIAGCGAAITTVALLVALEPVPSGAGRAILSRPSMMYLGKVSYGTYLWHWLVLLVLADAYSPSPLLTAAIALPIATGIASLSYHRLDRPRRTRQVARRVAVAGSAWASRCSLWWR